MAKLILKDLSIKNDLFNFNIVVRDGISIIGGDSSTGKTLYFKLQELRSRRFNDNKFIFINSLNKGYFNNVLNVSDKIIFVDNADIVVSSSIDVYRMIQSSRSQFIFFGRDVLRYDKNYDNWAELIEHESGKFYLRYVIRKADVLWQ